MTTGYSCDKIVKAYDEDIIRADSSCHVCLLELWVNDPNTPTIHLDIKTGDTVRGTVSEYLVTEGFI